MTRISSLYADLNLRTGSFRREVYGLRSGIRSLGGDVSLVSGAAKGFLLATGAAVAIAVRQFAAGEKAQAGLKSALAATGAEVDNNMASYGRFADQIASVTSLSVDQVAVLQTNAVNLGVSAGKVNDVVKAGVGLGRRFFGGDYQQGVRAASLAVQGNAGALRELIPRLQRVTTLSGILKAVNKEAAVGFREAKDDTKTFAGAMTELEKSTNALTKEFGAAFAPEVQKAAAFLQTVTEKLRQMTPEQRQQVAQWAEYATATAGTAVALGTLGRFAGIARGTLGGLFGVARGGLGLLAAGLSPIGLAVGAVVAGLTLVGAAWVDATQQGNTFTEKLGNALSQGQAWLKSFAGGIGDVRRKFDDMTGGVFKDWESLTDSMAMLFFAFEEATFGKNANDRFREYLAAKKADADKLAADQKAQAAKEATDKKKAADDQIKLEKEKGARLNGEYKAQFRSADQTYRDMQLSILKAGAESAAAQVAQANKAAAEKRKAEEGGDGGAEKSAAAEAAAERERKDVDDGLRATRARDRALQQKERDLQDRRRRAIIDSNDTGEAPRIDRELGEVARKRAAEAAREAQLIARRRELSGENPVNSGVNEKAAVARLARIQKENALLETQARNLEALDPDRLKKENALLAEQEKSLAAAAAKRRAAGDVKGADRLDRQAQDARTKQLENQRKIQRSIDDKKYADRLDKEVQGIRAKQRENERTIKRGGVEDNFRPNDPDYINTQIAQLMELYRQARKAGDTSRQSLYSQQIRDLQAKLQDPGFNKKTRLQGETPQDRQDRDTAKALTDAATNLAAAAKGIKTVGVVRD